jgi:peptidoglycan/xylan/chitin deacetylase (PgdA/CDA1 family)
VSRGWKQGVRNALVRAGGAAVAVRGPKAGKRALAFHEVPEPARFAEFLDRLLAEYDVLALQDWLSAPPADRTQLTLTFDDGYASWHESVAPLLDERGLPAVFFVSSGLVGLRGSEARDFARSRLRRTQELTFIGARELEDLARHPRFEVGGHTATHIDLGRIADPDIARAEIAGDQARLEDLVGDPVRWFAYPFGNHANVAPTARSIVEALGMSAAFTLIPGWWDPGKGDRFMIGRDGIDPELSSAVRSAWLRGGYDRLFSVKTAAGSFGRRSE